MKYNEKNTLSKVDMDIIMLLFYKIGIQKELLLEVFKVQSKNINP